MSLAFVGGKENGNTEMTGKRQNLKRRGAHRGFALPLALVWMACAGIAVVAVLSYVSASTRQAAAYAGRSECRLAAMSALERVSTFVYWEFKADTGNRALLTRNAFRYFENLTDAAFGSVINGLKTDMPGFSELKVKLACPPTIADSRAVVTFCATAKKMIPSFGEAAVTIAERVSYGIGRSRVFDHAYFVNTSGWFEGSTITANGDVRANGDMSLSQGPTVNGDVYAAPNEELGVSGVIKNDTSVMDSRSAYVSGTYGTANRARPLQLNPGDGGYAAPARVTSADLAARLHSKSEPLDMPWISDLNQYVEYAKELKSSLAVGSDVKIPAGAGYYTGLGPSGDAKMPDRGALVLEGTQANPIRLNGPVVVSNDVVIKGYVTGQGTIYSQRNIHIVGDIKYLNPPNWSGKTSQTGNTSKDLLGLAAKGNIVMGDCTSSSWLDTTLKRCLTTSPYVQKYACARNDDGSWGDGDIGYPKRGESVFGGNYTVADGGTKVKETKKEISHYEGRRKVVDGYTYTYTSDGTRKYYDSTVAPHEISSRASTITQIDAVLYNNHGIFGRLGACTINGSLVCRNEGMIFTDRLYINWDYRLYSGSPESVANSLVGLPVSTAEPIVLSWQEVPEDWIGGKEDD